MQEDEQRRRRAFRCDPQALQAQRAASGLNVGEDGAGRRGASGRRAVHSVASSSWRRRNRWILPVAVLGSSSVKLICRGYLKGARCCFT
ncbi:hypothetical protein G6F35_018722 [Rhizopus arrhizus]|nr:hypothetical protein G6F35_018722 [Rhizopus arrhizus]